MPIRILPSVVVSSSSKALIPTSPPCWTMILGDMAQMDFGRGSTIEDVSTHQFTETWILAMVLSWSWFHYADHEWPDLGDL